MLFSQTDDEEDNVPETTTKKAEEAKADKQSSRIYEFERKAGYNAREAPPIFGSVERSVELDRMFQVYPYEFIDHLYNQHKCKLLKEN